MAAYPDSDRPRRRDRDRDPRYYDDDPDSLDFPPPPRDSDPSTPRFRPRPPMGAPPRRKSILVDPSEPPDARHRRRSSRAENPVRLRASDDESEYAFGPPRDRERDRGDRDRRPPYPDGPASRHDLERKNTEQNRRFRQARDGYESEEGEALRRAKSFSPSRDPPPDDAPPRARSRPPGRSKADDRDGESVRGDTDRLRPPPPQPRMSEYIHDPDLREGYVAANRLPKPPAGPPPPSEHGGPPASGADAILPMSGKPRGTKAPSPIYDFDPTAPPPQSAPPRDRGPPPAYVDGAPVQRRRTVAERPHRPRRYDDDDDDDDDPPPRRRRDERDRDRDRDRLAPPRGYPPDRDDRGYGSDYPPPRSRRNKDWEEDYGRDRRRPRDHDDRYDRPPPPRDRDPRDRRAPPRYEDDYYSDYRDDRTRRRASLSDRDRYRASRDPRYDPRHDPRYDEYGGRDAYSGRSRSARDRERSRKRRTWQEEAGTLFVTTALPIIKKEGGRFLMKQAQTFLSGQGGGGLGGLGGSSRR